MKIPLMTAEAIIDDDDYDKIKNYKWFLDRLGYAEASHHNINEADGKRGGIKMHHLIMNSKKGQTIDHKNRNKLDNRKENLRFCTKQQNRWNTEFKKKRPSGYIGVIQRKIGFEAVININKKYIVIGRYKTAEEAAIAFNNKAKKERGEFAVLNVVPNEANIKPVKLRVGPKGIFLTKDNVYTSCISVNKQRIYLGRFKSKKDAIKSRNDYILKHRINRPLG